MVRRTRAQHKTDDLAFPIRVKFAIPRDGLGIVLTDAHVWLRENLGDGRYAVHSTQSIGTDALGVYFVSVEDAERFIAAMPTLQIADGTITRGYYRPGLTTRR